MVAKPSSRMKITLERMVEMLENDGDTFWSAKLSQMAREGWPSAQQARSEIRSMYGGMGSLNDLILEKNGSFPAAENEEFSALRSELYGLSLLLWL